MYIYQVTFVRHGVRTHDVVMEVNTDRPILSSDYEYMIDRIRLHLTISDWPNCYPHQVKSYTLVRVAYDRMLLPDDVTVSPNDGRWIAHLRLPTRQTAAARAAA